jgi:hypothetical protein
VAGQTDSGFALVLTNWLVENGLPARFYVSVLRMRAISIGSAAGDRSRKPMFVDIGSPPLVLAFERLAKDPASAAVFYEEMPTPEAAILDEAGVPRVTEYVFELNCQGDGK